MRFYIQLTIICFISLSKLNSQNTVGVITYQDKDASYEGYNLIFPHYQPDAFLLNKCGEIVHQWNGPEGYRNHNTCYILENGDLIRALRKDEGFAFIWEDIGENLIECVTWDNELNWSFEYLDTTSRIHHDIEPTPYGTVFLISWDHHSVEEAIASGRDVSLMSQDAFSPDKIIEYDPELDSIIWEWKAWDHLVQDRDSNKPNYGVIKDHPHRININWENNQGRADWMHVNSIDYNPILDQIMINVPTFNEIWIIDHSTTTEEAKGSSGGNSGKGGDIIWRWGNPQAYNRGAEEDQKLFFQHDALWALDYLPTTQVDFGNISVFNNQTEPGHSSIGMISPVFDSIAYQYTLSIDSTFLPENFYFEWSHPEPNIISSSGLSSIQVLPNNNKLITSGRNGITVELSQDEKIIWQYKTPFKNGQRVAQGTELAVNDNLTFRMRRYPTDYPGFDNHSLYPIEYLELNPDKTFCDRLLPTINVEPDLIEVSSLSAIELLVKNQTNKSYQAKLISLTGKTIGSLTLEQGITSHDISHLAQGCYALVVSGLNSQLFVKM